MDYEAFKNEFLNLTGINLHEYKEKQMKRRIDTLLERRGMAGYDRFLLELENSPVMREQFIDYITINVTEFFRTPEHWQWLEELILPDMVHKSHGAPRIWSSACATGEEPYSLVMSLSRLLPLSDIHVLATDLDDAVLERAEAGRFTDKAVETVPESFLKQYFTRVGNDWQIAPEIRQCVEFRQLNLLCDEYPSDCDLILCRNVLIYFTEEAKNQIYGRFYGSLRTGGCLFTGNTEQIIYYKDFGYKKEKSCLYLK